MTFRNRNLAKNVMQQGRHDTKRERPRPPPAESGRARRVKHVQETARRKVELSSSYFEDGSKRTVKRTLRLLSCNLRIILHVFIPVGVQPTKLCVLVSHPIIEGYFVLALQSQSYETGECTPRLSYRFGKEIVAMQRQTYSDTKNRRNSSQLIKQITKEKGQKKERKMGAHHSSQQYIVAL